jgi:hypothetical protein
LSFVIAGHFGLSAIVKSRAPYVPLWALMLATVWLDIVFVPLFLVGVESIEPVPGTHGGYGLGIIHANYTHSIVGALTLSFMLGFVAYRLWGRWCGLILGSVSMSHWLLDLVVHRADLPLWPGPGAPVFGMGLWRYPWVSATLEITLILAGAYLYWKAARLLSRDSNSGSRRRADLAAALIAGSGCAVLVLDVFS